MPRKRGAATIQDRNIIPADNRQLLDRINSKHSLVGIIGMGYVGLPLVRTFSRAGFATLGFDIDSAKIKKLRAGKSYIKHIPSDMIAELLEGKRFDATDDMGRL